MSSRSSNRYYSGRASLSATDVTGTYAAVTFTDDITGDTFSVIDTGHFSGLCVLAEETAGNFPGDVKVQARNEPGDSWVDFTAGLNISAGELSEVYHGKIYYREIRILVKDWSTAGAALDVSYCISKG